MKLGRHLEMKKDLKPFLISLTSKIRCTRENAPEKMKQNKDFSLTQLCSKYLVILRSHTVEGVEVEGEENNNPLLRIDLIIEASIEEKQEGGDIEEVEEDNIEGIEEREEEIEDIETQYLTRDLK